MRSREEIADRLRFLGIIDATRMHLTRTYLAYSNGEFSKARFHAESSLEKIYGVLEIINEKKVKANLINKLSP